MVTMFDEAFKQNPGNEDLGMQSFFANLRTSNWKIGQQVRLPSIVYCTSISYTSSLLFLGMS